MLKIKLFVIGIGRNIDTTTLEELVRFGNETFSELNETISLKEVLHLRNWMTIFSKKVDDSGTIMSAPYLDIENLGLVSTIGRAVFKSNGYIEGVVASDIVIDDFFQKLRQFGDQKYSYAFVIDDQGFIFLHHLYPTSSFSSNPTSRVHISKVECLSENNIADIVTSFCTTRFCTTSSFIT